MSIMIPIILSSRRFATRRYIMLVVSARDDTREMIQDQTLIHYINEMNENKRMYNMIKARLTLNRISMTNATNCIANINKEYREMIAKMTHYLVTTYPNYMFNARDPECLRIEYIPAERLGSMTIQYINNDEIIVYD